MRVPNAARGRCVCLSANFAHEFTEPNVPKETQKRLSRKCTLAEAPFAKVHSRRVETTSWRQCVNPGCSSQPETPVASALLLRPSRAEATTRRPNRTVSTGELRATPGVGQTMRILPVDPRAEKGKKPARTRFATSERQKTKRCASSESLDARGLLGIH